MEWYTIKSEADIVHLMKIYEDGAIFEILETKEEISLPDLLHLYDGQVITIQHI